MRFIVHKLIISLFFFLAFLFASVLSPTKVEAFSAQDPATGLTCTGSDTTCTVGNTDCCSVCSNNLKTCYGQTVEAFPRTCAILALCTGSGADVSCDCKGLVGGTNFTKVVCGGNSACIGGQIGSTNCHTCATPICLGSQLTLTTNTGTTCGGVSGNYQIGDVVGSDKCNNLSAQLECTGQKAACTGNACVREIEDFTCYLQGANKDIDGDGLFDDNGVATWGSQGTYGLCANECQNTCGAVPTIPGNPPPPPPVGCTFCGTYTDTWSCPDTNGDGVNGTMLCHSYTDTVCSSASWSGSCSSFCDPCQEAPAVPNPTSAPPPSFVCKEGVVEGKVFFDSNQDGDYDNGETILGSIPIHGELQSDPNNDWDITSNTMTSGGYNYSRANLDTGVWVIGIPPSLSGVYTQVTTPNPNPSSRTNIDSCGDHDELDFGVYQPGPTPTTPPGNQECQITGLPATNVNVGQSATLTVNFKSGSGWGASDLSFSKHIEWVEKDPVTGEVRIDPSDCAQDDVEWNWPSPEVSGPYLVTFNQKCNVIRATSEPSHNTIATAAVNGTTIIYAHMYLSYTGTDNARQALASGSHAFCETPVITIGGSPPPPPPPPAIYNISGTVYLENNGRWTSQSKPVVLDLSGADTKQTINDNLGNYNFPNLIPGAYTVKATSPTGYYAYRVSCSGCLPSQPDRASVVITNQDRVIDFYIQEYACLTGVVHHDNDPPPGGPDGFQDATEPGAALVNITAQSGLDSASDRTNLSGGYTIPQASDLNHLIPGVYTITMTEPPGYTASTSNPVTGQNLRPRWLQKILNGGGNECTTVNFGLAESYTISGGVYDDTDGDGTKDPGESYYNGSVTIDFIPTYNNSRVVYPTQSTYRIENIYEGSYTVSLRNVPTGYILTTPPTGSYTPITVGTSCTKPVSPPEADCDSNDNIINLNFGITNNAPWYQGVGGDMRQDFGFQDPIPDAASGEFASMISTLPGNTTHGVIFAGDQQYVFCIDGSPCKSRASDNPTWIVGGPPPSYTPEVFNTSVKIQTSYTNLSETAKQTGVTPPGLPGCVSRRCTLNNLDGLYKEIGNIEITGSSYGGGGAYDAIVLVEGDVRISGEIKPNLGSTLTIAASGDIIIDKAIGEASPSSIRPNIEGFFSAGNNFIVEGKTPNAKPCSSLGPDLRLNIHGVVIANAESKGGSVQNQRNLCGGSSLNPSYHIQERPDMIIGAPLFLKYTPYTWREVAP